jgi:NTE family protein
MTESDDDDPSSFPAPVPTPGPVAFALPSGANMGAIQVGMLRALVEHHIYPDLVLGSSIGAVNGAGFADDPTPRGIDRLERIWCTIAARDLFPRRRVSSAVALARRGPGIHPADGLRQVIVRMMAANSFEELKTPFHCVATEVQQAREAWFDSGPLVDVLLASTALPAVFPAVEIGGRRYMDGGVVVDVPIRRAVELGARTVYVLGLGRLAREWAEPRRPLDAAIEAYWIARRHRFQRDLAALPDDVTLHVLPHDQPARLRFDDVAPIGALIQMGYDATRKYLVDAAPA